MKREIKFRVWHTDLEEMMYEFVLPFANSRDLNKAFEILNSPIMQFTGLLDKNGKEIYEGDVINIETISLKPRLVIFDNGCFKYKLKGISNAIIYNCGDYTSDEINIIGNIYENSDLL
jgi:hypothetical protein